MCTRVYDAACFWSVHQATCDDQRVSGTSLAGLCELNCTLICGAHHNARICMHDVPTDSHSTVQGSQEEANASCGKSSGKRRCSSVRVSGSSSGRSVRYRGSRNLWRAPPTASGGAQP